MFEVLVFEVLVFEVLRFYIKALCLTPIALRELIFRILTYFVSYILHKSSVFETDIAPRTYFQDFDLFFDLYFT